MRAVGRQRRRARRHVRDPQQKRQHRDRLGRRQTLRRRRRHRVDAIEEPSQIYTGWTTIPLNQEPYAYEAGFVVRRLIQDQITGASGAASTPLLMWGPYLWADGMTPRKRDGLVYERRDLLEDGTHPSDSGGRKIADLLLEFFPTDPLTRTWYSRN